MTASVYETCHNLSLHVFIPYSLACALYFLFTFLMLPCGFSLFKYFIMPLVSKLRQ